MIKSRGILKPRKVWTDAEVSLLVETYADTPTEQIAQRLGVALHVVYRKAKRLGLAKSAAYMASPAACRLRRGDEVGKAFRFPKGHVPANKGRRNPGFVAGRMGETQFKKGQRNHNYAPIGSDRMSKDGYLCVKMTDTGYPPRDWVAVHQLVWELHHGPIPQGYRVSFKDGDKTNVVIKNLELVTPAEMMRRNFVHNLPPELVEVVRLRAVLVRKINKRLKKESGDEQRDNH